MCGFAGEFLFGPGRANVHVARRMAALLVHRGPDEDGSFLSEDGRCAIGFRRLEVIDPWGSRQPMSLPDGSRTVAFNGEIYNFRSLRTELSAGGAAFRSEGDTEVLLHLSARHGLGPRMIEPLDGMFAFIMYDSEVGRLLLARDRLGQKPLWYAILSDRIVFASEAKAILEHPEIGRHVNRQMLPFYATLGYIPAPHSAWQGIHKLLPAHYMLCDGGASSPEPYWWLPSGETGAAEGDSVGRIREKVTRAVEARMVSDVPLGALLSGGIDSAIVVALMAESAGSAGGVRTFTAGFEDSAYDERPAARAVAAHCGTEHTELLIRPAPGEMLDRLVGMYDEPFGDSSALPTFLICQAAREHVTVALAGDGGDEAFAGYDRYRALRLSQSIGPLGYTALRCAAALVRPIASPWERSRLRRLLRFADSLPYPYSTQYLRYRNLFGSQDLWRLFSDEFAAEQDLAAPGEWFCGLYEDGTGEDEVSRAQRHDLLTYLPDDLLVKADIASMASSLELRAPMLDHRVVEAGLTLKAGEKVCRRHGKVILRKAFADVLPEEVFRQPKRGFGVPLGRWLREDLREVLAETLLDAVVMDMGIFRSEAIAGLINDHVTGRDDHSHRLWALLVLARWLVEQQ